MEFEKYLREGRFVHNFTQDLHILFSYYDVDFNFVFVAAVIQNNDYGKKVYSFSNTRRRIKYKFTKIITKIQLPIKGMKWDTVKYNMNIQRTY